MKQLMICVLSVVFALQVQGQTVDGLIGHYSKAVNVDKVSIGRFGWNFVKLAALGNKEMSIAKKISSVQVMDLSECDEDVKNKFVDEVEKLNDNNYELLMKVKDDEDEVLILSKTEKSKIREFVVISKNDPAVIRLKGKFDLDDIVSAASFKL